MSGNTRFFISMGVIGFITLIIVLWFTYNEYKKKKKLKELIKKQRDLK